MVIANGELARRRERVHLGRQKCVLARCLIHCGRQFRVRIVTNISQAIVASDYKYRKSSIPFHRSTRNDLGKREYLDSKTTLMIHVMHITRTESLTSPLSGRGSPEYKRPPLRVVRFTRWLTNTSRSARAIANDGRWYAVKRSHPETGSQRLINEWLGSRLLGLLEIRSASVEPIEIPRDVYSEFRLRDDRRPDPDTDDADVVGAAISYPVNPDQKAIYDFIPIQLAHRVSNLYELLGTLVFDAWAGQSVMRHAVFHREGGGWVATVIDHAGLFGGSRWEFPAGGLSLRPRNEWSMLGLNKGLSFGPRLRPWIRKLADLRPEEIRATFAEVPDCWVNTGQRPQLQLLAESLISRQGKLGQLVM